MASPSSSPTTGAASASIPDPAINKQETYSRWNSPRTFGTIFAVTTGALAVVSTGMGLIHFGKLSKIINNRNITFFTTLGSGLGAGVSAVASLAFFTHEKPHSKTASNPSLPKAPSTESEAQEKLDALQDEAAKKDQELDTLRGQLDAMQQASQDAQQVATLRGQLEQKDQDLARIQGQVATLRGQLKNEKHKDTLIIELFKSSEGFFLETSASKIQYCALNTNSLTLLLQTEASKFPESLGKHTGMAQQKQGGVILQQQELELPLLKLTS